MAHAAAGDATSAHSALRRARPHTEKRQDDDPIWLDFYGVADVAAHEYRVAPRLGDTAVAEDAGRTAHALDDPISYARNHALGLIELC